MLLAAPPPPPRWDHKTKKEGTQQKTIEGVRLFKERSRLTRARKDLLCFKRNQRASPSRVLATATKIIFSLSAVAGAPLKQEGYK
ncbi:hypothetical protein A3A54_00725 [Candidatus Curtissbacteria bacterium RIFCSPLOWO2_01_FULL_39_62]|nr:MAG: hypothetical protein A2775_01015 [Candidatus Curtissbacteria bacterium RIFCSPHIGHO2_01_FULL_39_57]OGE01573.1 MAG: hypothetical protein A3A54_00725 [Candidatus Curtissbacteria bacterium RIFCSPLOWO2_01_FULL_39_62]